MKTCTICLITKSFDEFYKDPQIKDGFRTYCKLCWNIKSRKWGRDNRLKQNKNNRIWRKNNPDKAKLHKRKAHLKSKYNMTLDEVNQLKEKCENKCNICNQTRDKMVIDHNHKTGKVRGLLCDNCNRGIGLLQDSKEICLNAFNYLKE